MAEQKSSDKSRDQAAPEREGKRREGALSRPDEYGANEREQTAERERVGRTHLDEAGEVTDAEIEAREDRSSRD